MREAPPPANSPAALEGHHEGPLKAGWDSLYCKVVHVWVLTATCHEPGVCPLRLLWTLSRPESSYLENALKMPVSPQGRPRLSRKERHLPRGCQEGQAEQSGQVFPVTARALCRRPSQNQGVHPRLLLGVTSWRLRAPSIPRELPQQRGAGRWHPSLQQADSNPRKADVRA